MKFAPLSAALSAALLLFASLGDVRAQIQQILPFNYGVTGVRQDTGGNTLLTGGTGPASLDTATPAFLYDGPLSSIPSTTNGSGLYLFHYNNDASNGSQFYGPNTSLYDSSLGGGNIRAVGAYKNAGATYQNSMIYTGPLDGSGTWTNVVAPGNGLTNVGDTILHSTMGSLAVGNYDYQGQENKGLGFIYNLTNQSYQTISFGAYSTTAYGIWYNGGSKYSIVGGFSDVVNGGKAYIVNYNAQSQVFTDFASFSFNNDPSIVTHFEGIYATSGGFSICSTEVGVGITNAASYAFIPTNNDGSFGSATWTPVTNNISTNSTLFTGDTVIGNNVMGIYNTSLNGTNGIYSYQTVPEPSSYALLGIGGLASLLLLRRRAR